MDASSPRWLDDVPVLGKLPPEQAAAKLREVGEVEAADALERTRQERRAEHFGPFGLKWPFDRPWQYTSHVFGYLAPTPPGEAMVPIKDAGNIAPDETLKNSRLRIRSTACAWPTTQGAAPTAFSSTSTPRIRWQTAPSIYTTMPPSALRRASRRPWSVTPSSWGST
jgi:hypothetical protein